jgi:Flp pilus assembly protein TadD
MLAPLSQCGARKEDVNMDKSRTARLLVSCGGVAILAAAAVVVWIGVGAKERRTVDASPAPELVPAKLGTESVPGSIPPAGGAQSAVAGPVPVTGTEGVSPGSISGSLVLAKGETYYGKGEGFFKDGDFASATRYLRAEVERHPDRFHPTYLLGLSLWKEGRLDEAATTLTTASSLDAKSVKARVNLGRVLNDSGSFKEALAAADEAITLDPDSSPAHNVRGRALVNLRRVDEGIEAFKTAVEKDPANAYALNNLGYALIGQERFSEAVPLLEEAVRLKPEVGCFQNNLGMAYERTGKKDEAIATYRKAVQEGGSDHAGDNLARLGGTVDDENITPGAEESSN